MIFKYAFAFFTALSTFWRLRMIPGSSNNFSIFFGV